MISLKAVITTSLFQGVDIIYLKVRTWLNAVAIHKKALQSSVICQKTPIGP